MKKIIYFELSYWFVVLLILTFITKSLAYSFGASFFIASAILLGVVIGRVMYKKIESKSRRLWILNSIYLALAILFIEYLAITLVHLYLPLLQTEQCPEILINPFFLWIISIAFIIIAEILSKRLLSNAEPAKYIEFTSDRKKVKLLVDSIILIESNGDEVVVRTILQTSFRTKLKISHWETKLDSRFIRVHRSYIVNKNHVVDANSTEVRVGDYVIPISRKYRECNPMCE